MTLKELEDLKKKYKCIDRDASWDSRGNREDKEIYDVNGKFFCVEYCNQHPTTVFGKKGYEKNNYQPYEVYKQKISTYEWEKKC